MTTSGLVNTAIGVLAALVLLCYLDRLRLMNWLTHRWATVAMHVMWALWLGKTAYSALVGQGVSWFSILGVAGAALWIVVSRPTWVNGPPEHTETAPAPLDVMGSPGMVRARHRRGWM